MRGPVHSAERALGKLTARRGERVLGLLTVVALSASAILSLIVSPPDADQKNAARLLYIHVPSAWLAYLSFAVVFVASVAYLRTRKIRWDRLAAASAEEVEAIVIAAPADALERARADRRAGCAPPRGTARKGARRHPGGGPSPLHRAFDSRRRRRLETSETIRPRRA